MTLKKPDQLDKIPASRVRIRKIALVAASVSLLLAVTACSPADPPSESEASPPASVSVAEPPPQSSTPEESPAPSPEIQLPLFPTGQKGYTAERLAYEDGDLWLILPRLDLEVPIFSDPMDTESMENNNPGVTNETLKKGVCLFGTSMMPGEAANANTSLAGHRDIDGMEFYYLDTLTDGDLMYLDYDGLRYTYLYESTTIVNDDDWEPVLTKDYSCLTLQTCHPINVASHRMFVVGRLINVTPLAQIDRNVPPAATASELESGDLESDGLESSGELEKEAPTRLKK